MKITKALKNTLLLATFIAIVAFASVAKSATFTSLRGDLTLFGTVYADTTELSGTRGIGNITEVRNEAGDLMWDNTSEEVSFVFSDWYRSLEVQGLGGTTQFGSTGGVLDIYQNTPGTFVVTGAFGYDSLAIEQGVNLLSTVGLEDQYGLTAVGQYSDSSYSSNGLQQAVGGSLYNTLSNLHMTFNLTGDDVNTSSYNYSGAGSLTVATVPVPGTFTLLSLGLLSLTTIRRKI